MSQITLSKKHIEKLTSNRKMPFSNATKGAILTENNITLDSFEQAKQLADQLSISLSDLLQDTEESDLDEGIKICRAGQGFSNTIERDGTKYYTYQHLVTTKILPNLMPLHVTLHCNEESKIVLNGGHDSEEVIYVLKGSIYMHWETDKGEIRKAKLNVGDSAYLYPGISHSFMSVNGDSELIALNF